MASVVCRIIHLHNVVRIPTRWRRGFDLFVDCKNSQKFAVRGFTQVDTTNGGCWITIVRAGAVVQLGVGFPHRIEFSFQIQEYWIHGRCRTAGKYFAFLSIVDNVVGEWRSILLRGYLVVWTQNERFRVVC